MPVDENEAPPDSADRGEREVEPGDREARPESRDPRDPRDPRESRESRDGRGERETRPEGRSERETREPRERDRTDRIDRGEREGDRLSESIRARLEHLVPELVRKTFTAGLGAVYSTEEGIRKIAKDINLPDVAGYIASSADATKDRVMEVVARETREFLEHINLGEEIAKLLTTLSFEIKTEIRFIPNSDRFIGSEPDVKASVRLKRADEKDGDKAGERGEKDKPEEEGREREGRSRLRFWRRDDDSGDDKS